MDIRLWHLFIDLQHLHGEVNLRINSCLVGNQFIVLFETVHFVRFICRPLTLAAMLNVTSSSYDIDTNQIQTFCTGAASIGSVSSSSYPNAPFYDLSTGCYFGTTAASCSASDSDGYRPFCPCSIRKILVWWMPIVLSWIHFFISCHSNDCEMGSRIGRCFVFRHLFNL